MDNYVQKAKQILEKIPYITIASVTPGGLPWNSPVYAVHDNAYRFFWNSSTFSQHSKNIAANKNIFIVVYDSTVSEGEGVGVYIEAEAKELTEGEELEHAIETFYKAKNKEPRDQKDFLGDSTLRRFYQAVPVRISINGFDKNRVPPDYKVEITL
jgi:general stress protein 26